MSSARAKNAVSPAVLKCVLYKQRSDPWLPKIFAKS